MFPNSANTRLTLLSITSSVDALGNKRNIVKSKKEVIGSKRSITQSEYQTSINTSVKYDLKVVIQSVLYDESKFVNVNGSLYKIERTYLNGQFIELYLTSSNIEVEYGS